MTSPLRRKRQITLLNTKFRSRSKLRWRIAVLFACCRVSRFPGFASGLGLLAAVAVGLVASAAAAADEPAPNDSASLSADHSAGGHLHWRPSRSAQASRLSEE